MYSLIRLYVVRGSSTAADVWRYFWVKRCASDSTSVHGTQNNYTLPRAGSVCSLEARTFETLVAETRRGPAHAKQLHSVVVHVALFFSLTPASDSICCWICPRRSNKCSWNLRVTRKNLRKKISLQTCYRLRNFGLKYNAILTNRNSKIHVTYFYIKRILMIYI